MSKLSDEKSGRGEESKSGAPQGQRPEALRQFAEAAREDKSGKPERDLEADEKTAPEPASNKTKHKVATTLLHEGAEQEKPDPHAAGVDKLPDRIRDRR